MLYFLVSQSTTSKSSMFLCRNKVIFCTTIQQRTSAHSGAGGTPSTESLVQIRPKLNQSVEEKSMNSQKETFQMVSGNRTMPLLLPTTLVKASHF